VNDHPALPATGPEAYDSTQEGAVRRLFVAAALLATALAYAGPVRRWFNRWGSTADERDRAMPLDERIAAPTLVSTRAVTVHAPPDDVWPWIVQMGEQPRAGYYSYALVERMQGMRIESKERILPEFQELHVGDHIDRAGTMVVQHVDPPRALVLGPPPSVAWLRCTWAFELQPHANGSTRLVTRVRGRFRLRDMLRSTPPLAWPMWLVIEPGAFVMERKMLLEIKRLAERRARERNSTPARSES
jgi:hypothetical protein